MPRGNSVNVEGNPANKLLVKIRETPDGATVQELAEFCTSIDLSPHAMASTLANFSRHGHAHKASDGRWVSTSESVPMSSKAAQNDLYSLMLKHLESGPHTSQEWREKTRIGLPSFHRRVGTLKKRGLVTLNEEGKYILVLQKPARRSQTVVVPVPTGTQVREPEEETEVEHSQVTLTHEGEIAETAAQTTLTESPEDLLRRALHALESRQHTATIRNRKTGEEASVNFTSMENLEFGFRSV